MRESNHFHGPPLQVPGALAADEHAGEPRYLIDPDDDEMADEALRVRFPGPVARAASGRLERAASGRLERTAVRCRLTVDQVARVPPPCTPRGNGKVVTVRRYIEPGDAVPTVFGARSHQHRRALILLEAVLHERECAAAAAAGTVTGEQSEARLAADFDE